MNNVDSTLTHNMQLFIEAYRNKHIGLMEQDLMPCPFNPNQFALPATQKAWELWQLAGLQQDLYVARMHEQFAEVLQFLEDGMESEGELECEGSIEARHLHKRISTLLSKK